MHDLKLAIRNVLKNKRRTLLTLICLAAGVSAIVIVGGYYEYNYWGLRETLIHSQYAHVQLYRNSFLENEEIDPFGYLIENPDELIGMIEKDKRVELATMRLSFWGIASTEDGTTKPVKIEGIVPEKESLIFTFFFSRAGNELESGSYGQVQLGKTLADSLHTGLGRDLLLTAVDSYGSQNACKVKVRGIISSIAEEFDAILAKISLAEAQDLAGVSGVQEIVILLKDTAYTDSFLTDIKGIIGEKHLDLKATAWYERSGYYAKVVQFYSGYYSIILFITCVVVFFTTLNTLLMSAFERITEFGAMRSFGFGKLRLLRLFALESLCLGALGSALGLGVAWVISQVINSAGGIRVSKPPGTTSDFSAMILVVPSNIIIALGLALIVPVLASVIPAIKTMRMQIVEQIRYNDNA